MESRGRGQHRPSRRLSLQSSSDISVVAMACLGSVPRVCARAQFRRKVSTACVKPPCVTLERPSNTLLQPCQVGAYSTPRIKSPNLFDNEQIHIFSNSRAKICPIYLGKVISRDKFQSGFPERRSELFG